MYFSKKYWNFIIYIYKLNYFNTHLLNNLRQNTNSYLPYLFKKIKIINLYNGNKNQFYKIRNTNFWLKKLL